MDNFLPSGYTALSTSNYFKFKDGANTFRVLSSAIVGFEYWNTANKPVRSAEAFKTTPPDIRLDKDGNPTKIKHFWCFTVWSYDDNRVQIMEITQASIREAIKALVDNAKWGDPHNYDLTITRSGEGLDTSYQVMPNPHSELDPKIKEEYESRVIRLEALFDGEDPFVA